MTNSLFVSHHGDDLNNCGNWTMPCRTVRHAVKMSNDGDQIYIDYAQGRPYMECENLTQSTCSIELTKSVSFHGINGKAKIQCRKCYKIFNITSSSFKITRIKFLNLAISNSNTVAELDVGAKAELVFQNMLIRDNSYAIYSKNSIDCSIKIFNSSFEHNFNPTWGIYLRCVNLTVHINSSSFRITPLLFTNIANKPTRWKKTEILIQNTIFNGKKIKKCASMLTIMPFAAIFNVTISDSEFKNHFANCSSGQEDRLSTLQIYEDRENVRDITLIYFSNLIFENNYNNWATLLLSAGYLEYTEVNVLIRDSIFRNNSIALRVYSRYLGGSNSPAKWPTIILENNTFVENFYDKVKITGAAAITFKSVKSRVSSCRFLDNRSGQNPYIGVITIAERATVTFLNSYFENRQTAGQANQLFASGNKPVYFRGKNTFNLVALKKSQTVFIRVPPNSNTKVIMKKKFKIICPQGYKVNSQRECVNIKNAYMCLYITVQCEQCPTKTYTLERGKFIFNKSNDIQCQQCPRGGDCGSGLVTAKPNFWGFRTNMKIVFVQCPPGYCCDTEDCVTYDGCHGNRSGTLCGQCPEGMSESLFSTQCISNTECSFNYFFIIGTIAMLVLYLVFFLYHKEIVSIFRTSLFSKGLSFSINNRNEQRNNVSTGGNTSSPSGMIKIFFYYYQVCNLLRSSVGSFKKGQFIHNFENVISRVMNMVLVNLPSFKCPLKDLHAVPKAVILHSVGYCLLALLCLLYLISKLIPILRRLHHDGDARTALQDVTSTRSDNRSSASKSLFSQRVASAFTYISLLMYASSAKLCLSLLHCVQVGDNQVLFLDGNVKCYQTFQYFLLAYLISSILPFCLVPVFGSYHLKSGRIGVRQFCAACIFPLPFCCFWMYLLLKDCRSGNQETYNTIEENDNAVRSEQDNDETQSLGSEEITFTYSTESNENTSTGSESAILSVLLGPFKQHQAFMCFPSSHIPWEGFLVFRRLVLIILLTFVYDIQLRLFLALILCVAILICHTIAYPFQRKRYNVLESFSLGTHVVLCGSTLIKAIHYGEDYSSFSKSLPVLNVIENILIVAPLSIIMIVVIFSLAIKLVFGLKLCVSVLIRKVRGF
ncbi:Hypothetical predicted protein [Paramuricea clavata]|uniref:Uncharacterized protein n=1 Tax=Paramuricea clavata TaxID=317549 RepID=A0A6S7GUA0_PARCT|nr:Hypothetical predicted protein [Paramuricea clavata]